MTVALSSLHRAVAARRRPLAALLAGLAVLLAVSAVRPPAGGGVAVLAAARDLAPGTPLTLADLRPVSLPASAVPAGALRPGAAVLGRLVAGPVRGGEPLTDVRLVGPSLLDALAAGSVAVPVRLADSGAAALLRPGDRIDVLAAPLDPTAADHAALPPPADGGSWAPPDGPAASARAAPPGDPRPPPRGEGRAPAWAGAVAVAVDVLVLAVPGGEEHAYADGALVVVACSPAVARALATAATSARLSPALRPAPAPAATGAGPPGAP